MFFFLRPWRILEFLSDPNNWHDYDGTIFSGYDTNPCLHTEKRPENISIIGVRTCEIIDAIVLLIFGEITAPAMYLWSRIMIAHICHGPIKKSSPSFCFVVNLCEDVGLFFFFLVNLADLTAPSSISLFWLVSSKWGGKNCPGPELFGYTFLTQIYSEYLNVFKKKRYLLSNRAAFKYRSYVSSVS